MAFIGEEGEEGGRSTGKTKHGTNKEIEQEEGKKGCV